MTTKLFSSKTDLYISATIKHISELVTDADGFKVISWCPYVAYGHLYLPIFCFSAHRVPDWGVIFLIFKNSP